MKRIIFVLVLLVALFLVSCSGKDYPKDDPDLIVIYFFTARGCPSCDVQSEFMSYLENKYDDLEIKKLDVSVGENQALLDRLANAYGERGVFPPATFIADESLIGFGLPETTGLLIEDIIRRCQMESCMNPSSMLKAYER